MADNNTPITIADGSQIQFKHGTQSKLDEIRSAKSGKSGTFYLTNDTHRLYVGLSDNSIVPVNEGITTYATVNNLPSPNTMNAGQFAYIADTGILAVSNGKNWVQINANTDTTYTYGGLVEGDQTGTVTITTTLTETGGGNRKPSFAFSLTGQDGIAIVEGTTEGTIEVYGTRLASEDIPQNNAAKIKLIDKSDAETSSVLIHGGTNVSISEENGTIEISAVDTKLDGKTHTAIAHSWDPADEENKPGGFTVTVKDSANHESKSVFNPVIKYGGSGTSTTKFSNGTAILEVYTKKEVDALRANFDAMEYQGVINSIPTGSIKKGYTYKVGQAFDVTVKTDIGTEDITVQPGDLLIAEGKEGANGFLTTVEWGYVPSGNEDTTYSVNLLKSLTNGGGIQLLEKKIDASTGINAGSISVLSGKCITVSPTFDDNLKKVELTINHDKITTIDPNEGNGSLNDPTLGDSYVAKSDSITIIDASQGENGIDRDEFGHVEKVYTKTVTVYDTNARLTGMTSSVSADTAKTKATVSITGQVTGSKNQKSEATATFHIESINSNLQVDSSSSSVRMDLVWDKF